MMFGPNNDFNLIQGGGVERGQLMECVPVAITSAYSSKTRMVPVDILVDTLDDIGTWNQSLFLMAFSILTHLLLATSVIDTRIGKNLRGSLYRVYQLISSVIFYIFQKIPIESNTSTTLLVSLMLTTTLMPFLILFSSLLHVNLVKVDPPIVINDYQDIIDRLDETLNGGRKFRVEWSYQYPDVESFKQGAEGSKEASIWQRTLKIGGPHFVDLEKDIARADDMIQHQEMVVVINKEYAHFVGHTLCATNNYKYDFHSWTSVDRNAKWTRKGYILRAGLGTQLKGMINGRSQKVLEGGLNMFTRRILEQLKVLSYDRKNCSSDTILIQNRHDDQFTDLNNEPFKITHFSCLFIIIISLFLLFIEHVHNCLT